MKIFSLNSALFAALIALNAVVAVKFIQSQKSLGYSLQINQARNRIYTLNNMKIPENLKLLPNNKELDSNFSSQISKSDYSLVILFEPTQCGACLEEKILWNDIYKSGTMPVYAVTYLKDKQELNKYLSDSKTEIPVYQDTSAVIGRHLLPEGVPVKLIVNKKHEVIFVDYVRRTEKERNAFINMLKYFKTNN